MPKMPKFISHLPGVAPFQQWRHERQQTSAQPVVTGKILPGLEDIAPEFKNIAEALNLIESIRKDQSLHVTFVRPLHGNGSGAVVEFNVDNAGKAPKSYFTLQVMDDNCAPRLSLNTIGSPPTSRPVVNLHIEFGSADDADDGVDENAHIIVGHVGDRGFNEAFFGYEHFDESHVFHVAVRTVAELGEMLKVKAASNGKTIPEWSLTT